MSKQTEKAEQQAQAELAGVITASWDTSSQDIRADLLALGRRALEQLGRPLDFRLPAEVVLLPPTPEGSP